jgi:hypothetical protein
MDFFTWFESDETNLQKPWLILGKGPSYELKDQYDLEEYNVFGLNHTIRDQPLRICHAIDFDVVELCWEVIEKQAAFLVVPYFPHFSNKPSDKSILTLIEEQPRLKDLEAQGRLLWYHKTSQDIHTEESAQRRLNQLDRNECAKDGRPLVPVVYFSAEAALNLLVMAGIKKIRTLGIDGGTQYSKAFADLRDKTLLSNGQPSFFKQFRLMNHTILFKQIDYSPLNMSTELPIRVFVGSMPEQMLATKVLEYSIKKHTQFPVEVFPLFKAGIEVPMPKDPANRPRTPFSFQRFFIPQLKSFKGRAIYLDSDMHFFSDIMPLWSRDMEGADVLSAFEDAEGGSVRKPQFAVMLMDCERLHWSVKDIVAKLDAGELTYETLMFQMAVAKSVKPILEREWNSLEYYEEGKTHNLHYTDMINQPWLFTHNKLTAVWVKELIEAIQQGAISKAYLKEEILMGNVRPSLMEQVLTGNSDPQKLSGISKWADSFFIAPHERNASTPASKLKRAQWTAKIALALLKLKGLK